MPTHRLSRESRSFIDEMAALLAPWGMPQVAARLYGYLLLGNAPATLDEIAADLHVSKSSASVAARLLEQHSLARRHGERGSKRVRYDASDNYAGVLLEQSALLGSMAQLLQSRAATVASGAALERLETVARFYRTARAAIEGAVGQASGEA